MAALATGAINVAEFAGDRTCGSRNSPEVASSAAAQMSTGREIIP
jgi:hypothetical protein